MNGEAISSARALVRANPRRLTASWPRVVAHRRLLSAAAALTRVANARLRRRAVSLSRSVLLWLLSYARVPFVLVPAEAGGIRNIAPPNKEMGWVRCAK